MVLAPLAVLPLAVAAAAVVLVGRLDRPAAPRHGVRRRAGARARHPGLPLGRAGRHRRRPHRVVLPRALARGHAHRTVGPAGVVAVVLVTGLQAAGLAAVVRHEDAWWAVALLVCASRASLALACVRGVPAARADGLGASVIGSVPVVGAARVRARRGRSSPGSRATRSGRRGRRSSGCSSWRRRWSRCCCAASRRLGGITGDVLGAAVEVSFAVLVLAAASV